MCVCVFFTLLVLAAHSCLSNCRVPSVIVCVWGSDMHAVSGCLFDCVCVISFFFLLPACARCSYVVGVFVCCCCFSL